MINERFSQTTEFICLETFAVAYRLSVTKSYEHAASAITSIAITAAPCQVITPG